MDDPENYCTACFSGDYPIKRQGEYSKYVFEDNDAQGADTSAEKDRVE